MISVHYQISRSCSAGGPDSLDASAPGALVGFLQGLARAATTCWIQHGEDLPNQRFVFRIAAAAAAQYDDARFCGPIKLIGHDVAVS